MKKIFPIDPLLLSILCAFSAPVWSQAAQSTVQPAHTPLAQPSPVSPTLPDTPAKAQLTAVAQAQAQTVAVAEVTATKMPQAADGAALEVRIDPAPQGYVFAASALKTTRLGPFAHTAVSLASAKMGEKTPNQPFYLGQMLLTERELAGQALLKKSLEAKLQKQIQAAKADAKPSAELEKLYTTLQAMPVTGRFKLKVHEPSLMQIHSQFEPEIKKGDRWLVPMRPETVSVMLGDGRICQSPFVAGAKAKDYVLACTTSAQMPEMAYIVQPDGGVLKSPLASWNEAYSESPGPGAWIWASDLPQDFSEEFSAFLATQGVAITMPESAAPGIVKAAKPSLSSEQRDLPISASDWGIVGLLQTPTARMNRAGQAGINISRAWPYTYTNFMLQPFDGVEVAMRYVRDSTRLYGAVAFSGNQSSIDKSLDVKFKLVDESQYIPQLALGMRDPLGTGLFQGEYLVGSKRYGDFDFSLGLGWGYLGAKGNIRNPLGFISDRFKTRVTPYVGQGGVVDGKSMFTGPTALFGGLQWHSPFEPLSVKIEYEGNDYSKAYTGVPLEPKTPVNVALVYKKGAFDVTVGLERGKHWLFGVNFNGNLDELKSADFPLQDAPPPVDPKSPILSAFTAQSGWFAKNLEVQGNQWIVTIDNPTGVYLANRLQPGIAVLNNSAPNEIDYFLLRYQRKGVDFVEHKVDRRQWLLDNTQLLAASERKASISAPLASQSDKPAAGSGKLLESRQARPFNYSFDLDLQQSFGGPEGYLYAFYGRATASYQIAKGTWADGTLRLRAFDNYDKFVFGGTSALPRVRTHVQDYLGTSRFNLSNLQITHLEKINSDVYALAYAGYLETMFLGLGGEVMYRPNQGNWALGIDLNRVQMRDFSQHLGTRPWKVTTGHASLYWDTGWKDVIVKLTAGQYLAGDKGATLDFSRTFPNGARMGVWATKTNVSAADFGEGSFDKGVYLTIPFDAFFNKWSGGYSNFVWQPLLRDGGAMLSRRHTLWNLTDMRNPRTLQVKGKELLEDSSLEAGE